MIKVIAEDFIKEEFLDIVRPLYQELVLATKKEKECIEYNLYVDQDNKGHFVFIEEWTNQAALDKHCATEHFLRLVPMIDKYQYKEGTYIIMDMFENKP